MEAYLGEAASLGELHLAGEGFRADGGGAGVGHVEDCGHASGYGCARFGLHVGLMGEAGFAEMDMGVYASGDDVLALEVDGVFCDFRYLVQVFPIYFADAVSVYEDGSLAFLFCGYDGCVVEQGHVLMPV